MTETIAAAVQPVPPGTPFVVFGDDWNRNVSTMQHVFRHVSQQHPVIWINGIGHRVPQMTLRDSKRAIQKILAMFQSKRDRGFALGETGIGNAPARTLEPRVLPWHHSQLVHRYNSWSLIRLVRGALDEFTNHPPPVLVTGSPPSAGVVGHLSECASVYFCMDDFLHLPSTSPHMLAPLEARLLERVDAVVATAQSLTRTKRPASGIVHYLPQGVNYQHFATPRPLPHDLASLPRPIVGFSGAFYNRCDFDLIRKIAASNAKGSVVLVGPVLGDTSPIERSNVHILGPRPYRDLPAYVQGFDVGIIPYVLNEETKAVDPLKLLEYLAAGIPVVSTALPEARKYGDVVAIAEDVPGFVSAVMAAARESDSTLRERRQATARPHGWDQRADAFLQICAGLTRR